MTRRFYRVDGFPVVKDSLIPTGKQHSRSNLTVNAFRLRLGVS